MRLCDICGSEEAIYTNYMTGASLCASCLKNSIKRRAWSVMKKELRPGDKVMVAHSGGKDSSLALLLTKEFSDEMREFDLKVISVTVDEGTLYRRSSIKLARKLTERLQVKHLIIQMRDILGFSVEDLRLAIPKDWKRNACTYCGVLRRQILNAVAREIGATVLVTGHNLDDLVQTSIMNLVRGDADALVKTMRHERKYEEGLIPRVRPLRYVYEREIASLVVALGIPAHLGKCPMAQGMRISIRREIDLIEDSNPGAKLRAFLFLENLSSKMKVDVNLRRCSSCGEPTTSDICKVCQLRKEAFRLMGIKDKNIRLDGLKALKDSAFQS